MTNITQNYVDQLIDVIDQAEDPGSVTNTMVSLILGYLNSQGKGLVEQLGAEVTTREAADDELREAVASLSSMMSARIDALLGENASTAIDNFNEVIDFLRGLTDDAKLASILDGLRQSIAGEVEARKQADQMLTVGMQSANAMLKEHERQLTDLGEAVADHYEHVGIVHFEAVVDRHDSVLTGAPDMGDGGEEGEEYNPWGGMMPHVVFDRSRGRFLFEVHDQTYECPGGDAWETWPRASEFYNEDGAVRTDRIYRCGARLYRYIAMDIDDAEGVLVDYVDSAAVDAAIASAKSELLAFEHLWASIGGQRLDNGSYRIGEDGKELSLDEALTRYARNGFIVKWNKAAGSYGRYNEATELFELNGLTDITFDEALEIFSYYPICVTSPYDRRSTFYAVKCRTLFPITAGGGVDCSMYRTFTQSSLQVITFSVLHGQQNINGQYYATFGYCEALKTINGVLYSSNGYANCFDSCYALENIRITQLKSNISLRYCPKISIDSIEFMIDNAANTATITITVHPNVYAKLVGDTGNAAAALSADELTAWGAVLTSALAKNITFATT